MEQWSNRVALVTGASSGIGYEIAKHLVQYNITVFAAARRLDRLNKLAECVADKAVGKLIPIRMDVTNESDVISAFETIHKETGSGVDILINNAGVLVDSTLADGKTDDWLRALNTNVIGLCIVTREAVRSLNARNVNGHIIHINSVVGHKIPTFVGRFLNIYPATKYAVTALAETLRQELHHNQKNIKVTSLSPGLVKTDIAQATNIEGFNEHFDGQKKILDPEDVAKAVIYVLSTPPHVLISELTIRPMSEP